MALEYPELRLVFLEGETNYTLEADSFYRDVWGNGLNNTLTGNAFDNYLNGDGGVDTLIGGAGNDTYRVDQPGDEITELAGEGIDTVWSNVGYTLGANVENLILVENANPDIDGTGNELANSIRGNSGVNLLVGLGGNDTLDGGTGADFLEGGTGDDTYVVDNVADAITELAGEGTDTVVSSLDFTLEMLVNVENVVLTGSAVNATGNDSNNSLTGNAVANVLRAGIGDDVLNGAGGADYMEGGVGNDIYYVDNAGDQVVEAAAGGTDSVYAGVSHSLAAHVENLFTFGSGSISLTGNTLANTITGNSGANKINGGLGNDVLRGGAGKDIFILNTKASSSNVDKVLDFSVKDDTFRLDNAIFKKLGSGTESSPKKLSKDFFKIGTKAQDRNDYLVYNNKTGALSYDADGSGSGKAVLIATLSKNLKLTTSDFYVI